MKDSTLKLINKIIIWACFLGLIFCIFAAVFDEVRIPYIITGLAFFLMIIDGIIKIRHIFFKEKIEEHKFERQWEKKNG